MPKQSDVVERGSERFNEFTGKEKEGEMDDEREIEGKHRKKVESSCGNLKKRNKIWKIKSSRGHKIEKTHEALPSETWKTKRCSI